MCSDEASSSFTAVAPAASSASRVSVHRRTGAISKRRPVTGVNGTLACSLG